MLKDALDWIKDKVIDGVKPQSVNGFQYTPRGLELVKLPLSRALEVSTLTSLVDFVKANVDRLAMDKVIVHVESPVRVKILGALNEVREREAYIVAQAQNNIFNFGQWYDHEGFVIALQTLFEPTEARESLIKIASTITDEMVKVSEDDGITQRVTAKAGIARRTELELPNPVKLKPYRTFTEITQPEGVFVFRASSGMAQQSVKLALFEADNLAWSRDAVKGIKEWIKGQFGEDQSITIIG